MHGGTNPGAPLKNTNAVVHGDRMMEDAVAAKANTAIRWSIYGMIKNTVTGYENKLPPAAVVRSTWRLGAGSPTPQR
jgi:hypothetical protein